MAHLRRSISAVLLLAIAIIGSAACTGQETAGEAETVDVVAVRRGDLTTDITAAGSVYYGDEITLSFDIGGRLVEMAVSSGDLVQEGDTLAHLDTADLELQVRSAEAGLAAAAAQLAQLQEGPSSEQVAVAEGQLAAAEASLAQAVAARDQLRAGITQADIAAAQASLAAAAAEQKAALLLHNRTMKCETIEMPGGAQRICPSLGAPEEEARFRMFAADEALTAAQAQLDAVTQGASARLRNAAAAVDAAVAQRNVAQAQLELLSIGASPSQIAGARANITQAEIALDTARLALERTTLSAPTDGIVVAVNKKTGELVAPQGSVLRIADYQRYEVRGSIDEADIGLIGVGKEVRFSLDAYPGQEIPGYVSAIAPTATFEGGLVSYEVTVEIGETDVDLRDGMTANLVITRERRENVLVVPSRAIWIDPDSGRPFVERQIGEDVEFVYVEQGITSGQLSEIQEGLEEGDQLVLRSSSMRDRFREMMTATMTGGSE